MADAKPSGNYPGTENAALIGWVEKVRDHCTPDRVFWCDGSDAEKKHLTARRSRRAC